MRRPSLIVFLVTLVLVAASAAQLRQVALIDIPGRPGFDTIVWADGKLVIAHPGADKVDVFDPARRRVIAQIPDMKEPRGIAVDTDADKVYIANAGANSIAVIDPKTWKVENQIAVSMSPNALLLVPGGKLYVTDSRNGMVSVVDPKQGGEVAKVDMGGLPQQMAWDPDQHGVFVTLQDKATVALLGEDNHVTKQYKLMASQPTGLALDAKQRRLYVAVRYAVLVVNADSGSELARIPAAGGADTLWLDGTRHTLYIADTGGSVNMVSTDNNQYVSQDELQTQVKGHTMAFDPAKRMVYMPGGREGRSKLVILKQVQTPQATAPANAKEQQSQPNAKTETAEGTTGRR